VEAFFGVGHFVVLQAAAVAFSADAPIYAALFLLASQHLKLSKLDMVVNRGDFRKCQLWRSLCSPFVIRLHVILPYGPLIAWRKDKARVLFMSCSAAIGVGPP